MGHDITLTASDGFVLDAYRAEPEGKPRGGLVVLQEIFGINRHIRSVADQFAALGYLAVAPALFDRVKPGVQLGYGDDGRQDGLALNKQTNAADTLKDVAAAVASVAGAGRVGVVGYCWGGTLAYAAAAQLPGVAAAVGYYGGGIVSMLDKRPVVPLMLHFGELDQHIPMSAVEAIGTANPSVPIFTYPAGHGFNCDERASYDKASASLALERTLEFLRQNVG